MNKIVLTLFPLLTWIFVQAQDTSNDSTANRFIKYLSTDTLPPRLTAVLKKERATIARSSDRRVVILSWSTAKDEILGFYSSLVQYNDGKRLVVRFLLDATKAVADNPGRQYDRIFVLKGKTGNTIYCARYQEVYSNVASGQGLKAFSFDADGTMQDVNLFNMIPFRIMI